MFIHFQLAIIVQSEININAVHCQFLLIPVSNPQYDTLDSLYQKYYATSMSEIIETLLTEFIISRIFGQN